MAKKETTVNVQGTEIAVLAHKQDDYITQVLMLPNSVTLKQKVPTIVL